MEGETIKKITMKKILFGQAATDKTVSGKIVLNTREAIEAHEKGDKVILVKHHTTPDDFDALMISEGVLTNVGGLCSHASITAREFGKGCIINCDELEINENKKQIKVEGGQIIPSGTNIILDGYTGNVYLK